VRLACDKDSVGFGFTSYRLRKWRELVKVITKRSKAKPKQMQTVFYSQLKTTLILCDDNRRKSSLFVDIMPVIGVVLVLIRPSESNEETSTRKSIPTTYSNTDKFIIRFQFRCTLWNDGTERTDC